MAKRKEVASSTPLLDSLGSDQARYILARLVRSDPVIAARAEGFARDFLGVIDTEKIADSLADELSGLTMEEVWETSGRRRDGEYIYPSERAWEMMDEVVTPYKDEMMAYIRRGMHDESRRYCQGILLGIQRFQQDSGSLLCEEEPDYCDETFGFVREDWEKAVGDAGQVHRLACFIEEKGLL